MSLDAESKAQLNDVFDLVAVICDNDTRQSVCVLVGVLGRIAQGSPQGVEIFGAGETLRLAQAQLETGAPVLEMLNAGGMAS